ncbi:MAG: TlpA family protein disulfide reductase [Betaproteobacteria bacterium]|nr:TlpA family protein disulfide reductase [Betaproteobacteria bacterium]
MRKIVVSIASIALACLILAAGIVTAADKANEKKLLPGDAPPAALGITRAGDEVETTQFAGRVMVVTFWASWCGPCRSELAMLEGLQQGAKERVKVVAVNIEERDTFRRVARALSSFSITLTNDPRKVHAGAYGVNGIPHMVIIGKDGKVVSVHRGYSEDALDGLLAEINAALVKG